MDSYLRRDEQGHHEVAVKHTCSAAGTYWLKRKGLLCGPGTNRRQKGEKNEKKE